MTVQAPAQGKRALLCLLPGLGDALIASPIARSLVDAGYTVDALTMLGAVERYARDVGLFRNVYNLPLLESAQGIGALFALRRSRYDIVCVPAPAARWQYAAVALALGGRETYLHRYGGLFSVIASIGKMTQVELAGGHRSWENRRLAESMALRPDRLDYEVPASWRAPARDEKLLGIHAGSMRYKGNERKRWPLENFAAVAASQLEHGRRVRVFFGPSEIEDAQFFQSVSGVECIERPLDEAARAIDECSVFLGNDSGLTHLAAGLGVTVVTMFGMTDPERVAPVGNSIVVRPSLCPPCFDEGMREFTCVRNIDYRCIRGDISTADVNRAIERAFGPAPQPHPVVERSELRLYGRVQKRL